MLFTCDLICWGAASPGAFQSFLAALERRTGERVASYAHRGSGMRSDGAEIATYADGSVESGTTATLAWRRIWYDRLCRESCYRCGHHSLSRPGDLTVGDWWGLGGFMPGLEDAWGVSCAIASTPEGLSLLRASSGELELAATPVVDVANPSQPMLLHPPERKGRDGFWRELYGCGFEAACRSVGALGPARAAKDLIKKAISEVRGGSIYDASPASADRAWEEVPKVDFDELESRGEYPVAFAARNRDDDIRRRSSSGGMYHALASHVIDGLGGVVYGCAFDGGLRAIHIRCETMAEAERCMGSKYSQSDMGDSIRRVRDDLRGGRAVLFTGTPCQVAAVRAACSDLAGGGVLMTADIICHGVPSPEVFQGWLAELERARGARVVRYGHRPKSRGWGHVERVTWEDGHIEQGTRYSEAWKRLFYGNRMLRPSCYRCPYTVTEGRPGDLTVADFWGVEGTQHARNDDAALGVSLVLANRGEGLQLLRRLDLDLEAAALAEALPRNPMLERPSAYEGDRSEPWRLLYGEGMLPMVRRERYLASPARFIASGAKRAAKRILGR